MTESHSSDVGRYVDRHAVVQLVPDRGGAAHNVFDRSSVDAHALTDVFLGQECQHMRLALGGYTHDITGLKHRIYRNTSHTQQQNR